MLRQGSRAATAAVRSFSAGGAGGKLGLEGLANKVKPLCHVKLSPKTHRCLTGRPLPVTSLNKIRSERAAVEGRRRDHHGRHAAAGRRAHDELFEGTRSKRRRRDAHRPT